MFSIAETVTVHTCKGPGQIRHAFTMSIGAIKKSIKAQKRYHPTLVEYDGPEKRTKIVLTGLKKRRVGVEQALRKRIARRFSVIGLKTDNDAFEVHVNGKPIDHDDRDDLKGVEFLWEFGETRINQAVQAPKVKRTYVIDDAVDAASNWIVKGWLAAAPRPTDLRKEDAGSMNGIVVVARGRLIQENILDKLDFNRIFTNYVTGQIEADFLDLDGQDDIATSDRQRLIEDDDRYMALLKFLRNTLLTLSEQWVEWRTEQRTDEALVKAPKLVEWLERLPEGQRKPARKMLGLIEGVEVEKEDDRKSLYRAGVLAFERMRLREASHLLGELKDFSAESIMPLLEDLTLIEGSMYRDIVKQRLAVIQRFTGLHDDKAKETVLQEVIFEHMWLLDPGWERAAESPRMEQTLRREYGEEFAEDLTEKQTKGRIDIRYRTNAGQHIIVELKRSNRVMAMDELMKQGNKYRTALDAILKRLEPGSSPNIALVFVLGKPIAELATQPEMVRGVLQAMGARVVYYDQLIKHSGDSYAEFLEATKDADAIDKIVSAI
jgi:hypothetical protein